jgi:phospholipase/lecithinase/hemolysin
MRKNNFALAILTAATLAACGGDCEPPAPPPPPPVHLAFSAQVAFGDALSDVGSYAVGHVLELGGGKFTINGDNTATNPALTGKNWTEVLAAQLGLPAPCAAQTGLEGDPARGFSVPRADHAGCLGYAQGGARVSDPAGLFSAASGSPLGALTLPVAAQVANHLAAAGKFSGTELVLINAGEADLRAQLDKVKACDQYGLSYDDAAQQAVDAMRALANELGELVKNQVIANGANFVVVNNLPDPASTPAGQAETGQLRDLASAMAAAFNEELRNCFDGMDKVLLVDLAALVGDEVANPGAYGLADAAMPACASNELGGLALVCNGSNTLPGVDVSHFLFADGVHFTPFQNALLARNVADRLKAKGWL